MLVASTGTVVKQGGRRIIEKAREEKEVRCSMKRVNDCDTGGGGVKGTLCLMLVASTTTVAGFS